MKVCQSGSTPSWYQLVILNRQMVVFVQMFSFELEGWHYFIFFF